MNSVFEQIKQRDDELYQKYATCLEAYHKGEFVAVGLNGEIILGKDHPQVLKEAIERFGSGNFALRKIGANYVLRWRRMSGS
ncbi:hypothetical protein M1O13_01110 [Dehalococcoidia bacterium]|nr:hypothetical protein [Dehalococcoidia bacterium]